MTPLILASTLIAYTLVPDPSRPGMQMPATGNDTFNSTSYEVMPGVRTDFIYKNNLPATQCTTYTNSGISNTYCQ